MAAPQRHDGVTDRARRAAAGGQAGDAARADPEGPEAVESPDCLAPSRGAHPAGAAVRPAARAGARLLVRRLSARVRVRRWAARALALVPGLGIGAVDLSLRSARLATLDLESRVLYGATLLLGGAFWGALVLAASRRRGAARWVALLLLSAGALLAVGGQVYAYHRYQAFLDDNSVLVGTSMMPSVRQQLWFDRQSFALTLAPPLLVGFLLVVLSRRLAPTRPMASWASIDVAAVTLCAMAFGLPAHGDQKVAFDVLYLSGMGRLGRALWDHNECVARLHPGPRTPEPVPELVARQPVPRNVLFLVTESVRAQSVCVTYDEGCTYTPFTNAVAPDRIGLRQLRAVDSTTAISLSVMWSGLSPVEPRAALHSAPLLWEYARAAGFDTAYWTSQNLLFGNSGTWLEAVRFDHHVSATAIEVDPTLELGADDGKLADHVVGEMPELREPYFAVVHFSNTHFPYWIDEDDAPFQPQSEASGPGYAAQIKNRYQDAIYRQDRSIARVITAVRERATRYPTVIVYVSDHGEQMREKGAVGHTGTLFDPEIRVPFWVDAPEGALTAAEESNLRTLKDTPLTTLDVMPTMMDLMGLWDAQGIEPFRARIPGQSLLRGGSSTAKPVLLTNCTQLWACAFRNWGAIRGTQKLVGTQVDRAWNCFDLASDPEELHDLGPAGCGDLAALAETELHGRPWARQ